MSVCLPAADLLKGDKTITYYVYFLKSLVNKDLYIGSAKKLETRINLHNKGRVKSTKAYKPWELLDYETYNSRSEAVRRERFLKSGYQRELLKKKYAA